MKTTTKILIGMTALPFVLLILGWGAIAIFGQKALPERRNVTVRSGDVAEVVQTGAFTKVRVIDKDGAAPSSTVTIRKASNHAIMASDEIADRLKWDIEDGLLTVRLAYDDHSRYYNANIEIYTPSLTECDVEGYSLSTCIRDFESDSMHVNPGVDFELDNCNLEALLIDDNDNDNITLTNTTIGRLHAYGNHELNFNRSSDSHIGTLAWQPAAGHPNYYVYMNHVNVDNLVWLGNPEGLDNLQINSKGRFNLITKND